ncbi:MAG: DUF6273 domain-containing protein [Lachnospiraceae bacterium]|nr:DUF6273 domain-containing protein [Lachnospiraceae bacterium]
MRFCYSCMNMIKDNEKFCHSCGKPANVEVPLEHVAPGSLLNKRYTVGMALGQGGFGITYIGYDNLLQRKVAIKEYFPTGYATRNNTDQSVLHGISGSSGDAIFLKGKENFLTEARNLAKFSEEPGIVSVVDFFEESNTAYIIMEYLDSVSMKQYLDEKGKLSVEETLVLLQPVMSGLSTIHAQGMIHRDISLDNILITNTAVKLIDFGAARDVSGQDQKSLSIILKPGYAPEEQYRSKGNQGPWTDVYALSATIYRCITGVTPDEAPQRMFQDELKRPSELGVNISRESEEALMKGLAVKAGDRYQNVGELMNGLFSGINNNSVFEHPVSPAMAGINRGNTSNIVSEVRNTLNRSQAQENQTVGIFKNSGAQPVQQVSQGVTAQPVQQVSQGVSAQPVQQVSQGVTAQPVQQVSQGVSVQPAQSVSQRVASQQLESTVMIPNQQMPGPGTQTQQDTAMYSMQQVPVPVTVQQPPKKKKSPVGKIIVIIVSVLAFLVVVMIMMMSCSSQKPSTNKPAAGKPNTAATVTKAAEKQPSSNQTPTKAPTKTPTKTPTKAPTQAPTQAPTKAPTTAPTEAAVSVNKYFGNDPEVGDTITFGLYEQDNNSDNGAEPIEWLVIRKQGEYLLLLSKKGLDAKPFSYFKKDVSWENSDLRSWLNTDFYYTAFNDEEKEHVGLAVVENPANPDYSVGGGDDTWDYVFLLSVQEATKYFNSNPEAEDPARVIKATEYARANGAYVSDTPGYFGNTWWWLRTSGEALDQVAGVRASGIIRSHGFDADNTEGAICPAIWVLNY